MLSEQNPFIQSTEIVELYKAIAEVQKKHIAFHASTANPHFKNKFAPYPEMLADFAAWNSTGNYGLVFSCKPFLKGVKCTIIHTPSGQFETWYAMIPPELVKDVNAWKGANTSMGRTQLAGTLGMGADPDADQIEITHPETKSEYKLNNEGDNPWLNLTNKDGSPNQKEVDAFKANYKGEKTIAAINKEYKLSKQVADYLITILPK